MNTDSLLRLYFIISRIIQYSFNNPSYLCAAVTEDIGLCMDEISDSCSPTPTCIEVPALNGGQTLILALPFLSITTGSEEDLLCPVHPLPGERCVDLFSCNRFRESAYANSITICRTRKSDFSLEMCFHNVSDIMNGTRIHFFYSNLHCHPNGIQPESSRTYIKSMQLVVINPAGTYTCIVLLSYIKLYLWLSNLL